MARVTKPISATGMTQLCTDSTLLPGDTQGFQLSVAASQFNPDLRSSQQHASFPPHGFWRSGLCTVLGFWLRASHKAAVRCRSRATRGWFIPSEHIPVATGIPLPCCPLSGGSPPTDLSRPARVSLQVAVSFTHRVTGRRRPRRGHPDGHHGLSSGIRSPATAVAQTKPGLCRGCGGSMGCGPRDVGSWGPPGRLTATKDLRLRMMH